MNLLRGILLLTALLPQLLTGGMSLLQEGTEVQATCSMSCCADADADGCSCVSEAPDSPCDTAPAPVRQPRDTAPPFQAVVVQEAFLSPKAVHDAAAPVLLRLREHVPAVASVRLPVLFCSLLH